MGWFNITFTQAHAKKLTRSLSKRFDNPAFRDAIAEALIHLGRERWIALAGQRLRTSRGLYISAIGQPRKIADGHWAVSFEGPEDLIAAARTIEHGTPGFTMNEQLVGAGRDYRIIPFKHGHARASQNKTLHPRLGHPFTRPHTQEPLGVSPALAFGRKIEAAINRGDNTSAAPFTRKLREFTTTKRLEHTSGLYERIQQERRTANPFITFRTVSRNGKDWMYPPTQGVRLLLDVDREVRRQFHTVLARASRLFRAVDKANRGAPTAKGAMPAGLAKYRAAKAAAASTTPAP